MVPGQIHTAVVKFSIVLCVLMMCQTEFFNCFVCVLMMRQTRVEPWRGCKFLF